MRILRLASVMIRSRRMTLRAHTTMIITGLTATPLGTIRRILGPRIRLTVSTNRTIAHKTNATTNNTANTETNNRNPNTATATHENNRRLLIDRIMKIRCRRILAIAMLLMPIGMIIRASTQEANAKTHDHDKHGSSLQRACVSDRPLPSRPRRLPAQGGRRPRPRRTRVRAAVRAAWRGGRADARGCGRGAPRAPARMNGAAACCAPRGGGGGLTAHRGGSQGSGCVT